MGSFGLGVGGWCPWSNGNANGFLFHARHKTPFHWHWCAFIVKTKLCLPTKFHAMLDWSAVSSMHHRYHSTGIFPAALKLNFEMLCRHWCSRMAARGTHTCTHSQPHRQRRLPSIILPNEWLLRKIHIGGGASDRIFHCCCCCVENRPCLCIRNEIGVLEAYQLRNYP